MQRLSFSGILTDTFYIPIEDEGQVFVTVILDPRDPANVADSIDVAQGSYAGAPEDLDYLSDIEIHEYFGSFGGNDVITRRFVLDADGPRGLGLQLNSGYTDESSSWSFEVIISPIDTGNWVFEPATDEDDFMPDPDAPGTLVNAGPMNVYYAGAASGLSFAAGTIHLDPVARTFTIDSQGGIFDYIVADGSSLPLIDELLVTATFSLDANQIGFQGQNFTLINEEQTLGWLPVTYTDIILDDRGAVFGFLALNLPDAIGAVGIISDPTDPERTEGVLSTRGGIVGPSRWFDEDFYGGSVLGLMSVNVRDATIQWDEAGQEISWVGELQIRDFVAPDTVIDARITGGGRGFYATENSAGLDGSIAAMGLVEIPLTVYSVPVSVYLSDLTLDFSSAGEDTFDVFLRTGFAWNLGGQRIHLPEAEAQIVVDRPGLGLSSLRVSHAGLNMETPLAGFLLTSFNGGIDITAGEPDENGDPTTSTDFTADVVFDLFGDDGMSTLARIAMWGGDVGSGFGGSGFGLSVYNTAGETLLAGTNGIGLFGDEKLSGVLDVDVDLPVLGSFEAAIRFDQRYGASGALHLWGNGDVTLPETLAALFDLEGPVNARLDALLAGSSASDGLVSAISMIETSWIGAGEFGVRVSLEGDTELVGGLGFGDADPGAVAARGAGGGSTAYTLDQDVEGLAMRAAGDVDSDDVTIVAPDGTRYTLADFATRGIVILNDDDSGVTLLVPDAEAGEWVLEAEDADSFSGYADLPNLAIDFTAVGNALHLEATAPTGMSLATFDWRVFADTDGDGFDGVLVYQARDAGEVLDLDVDALGLAPGTWHLHAELSSGVLAPVSTYLPAPITITTAADLSLQAGVIPPSEDGEPRLLVRIANTGDATAFGVELGASLPGFGTIGLPNLEPGEVRVLEVGLPVDISDAWMIDFSLSHGGYEADSSDNYFAVSLPFDAADVPADTLLTLDEDTGVSGAVTLDGAESVTIVTGPDNGEIELESDGSFTYTPDDDFAGGDVITYRLDDGREGRVWFLVSPLNDAPTLLTPIDDATVVPGAAFDLAAAGGHFDDIDGEDLTYELAMAGGSDLPDWLVIDPATGRISGTAPAEGLASLELDVTARDASGEIATDRFLLNFDAATQRLGTPDADALIGDAGRDWLRGLAGNDRLFAGAGNDTIDGDEGHDLLDGQSGADTLRGGIGNDRYRVDNVGDVVIEQPGAGIDIVYAWVGHTLADEVERLAVQGTDDLAGTGNGLDNILLGNAGSNRLRGMDGNDQLRGELGADTLEGGDGNDRYWIDDLGDVVIEQPAGGLDYVYASVDHTLSAEIERLYLEGVGGLSGTGNALDNVIFGGSDGDLLRGLAGDDQIRGGLGADTMEGGLDNDRYWVDDTGDAVVEAWGEGIDSVYASVDHTLATNVERLYVQGSGGLTGTGNELANILNGNTGDDWLRGLDGKDQLRGGLGADTLEGGAGADRFVFDVLADSTADDADLITDFVRGVDRVKSAALGSAPEIDWIDDAAFSGTGGIEARVWEEAGETLVAFDTGNGGQAEMLIRFQGSLALTQSDFLF